MFLCIFPSTVWLASQKKIFLTFVDFLVCEVETEAVIMICSTAYFCGLAKIFRAFLHSDCIGVGQ